MLSAIAARKATQAIKKQESTAPQDAQNTPLSASLKESSSSSSEYDLELSPSPPPPPVRKRKTQGPDSQRRKRQKKRAKLTSADIERTRYFEAQQPIEGFDEESSEIPEASTPAARAYSPSRPVQDIEFTQDDDLELSLSIAAPTMNREYSPPVPDSSASDDEVLPHRSPEISTRPQKKQLNYTTLSGPIFIPRLNSNTFRLTGSELAALRLPADSGTLILLSPGHTLTFVGTAIITILKGSVTIFGTTLAPSLQPHRVFSPRSSPLASLEVQSLPGVPNSIIQPDHPAGGALPQQIQNVLQSSESVVVLQRLHSGVEGLGKVCRTFDGVFSVEQVEEMEEDPIGIPGFHLVDLRERPNSQLQPFFLPESWGKTLDSMAQGLHKDGLPSQAGSLIALVKGSKKCGKSTFARTLLNRLLARYRHVAFLECDLGQSEFTPGGMVSLHVLSTPIFGPPFTHPMLPHRAHYVGQDTPRSSPAYYLSCVEALVQTYRVDVQYGYGETATGTDHDGRIEETVPLVVNTHGWIKGLGADLLRKIEEVVQATDIFELDAHANGSSRQAQASGHRLPSVARLHMLEPVLSSPLAAYYTAADHRTLAILSYFHHCFGEASKWTTKLPLCAQPPWEVDCREAIDRIILVGAGYEDVIPQEIDRAINCGIVALVCDESNMAETGPPLFRYEQGGPTPSPMTSECKGLALIRGVDVMTQKLHILTPLPPGILGRCRTLVKGELEMPVWGMLDFRESEVDGVADVAWDKVPYLKMGASAGAGAGRRRIRRNLMRRAQVI